MQTCENCRFCHQKGHAVQPSEITTANILQVRYTYQCRVKHPPWEHVEASDWCGEWKEKEKID